MVVKRSKVANRAASATWHTPIERIRLKTISPLVEHAPQQAALRRLIKLLGNNQTAQILGVSNSQASRWLHGEPIGPESARRIADFDYVLGRAMQVLHPDEAAAFFTFPQPFLRGARPIDVLVTRGVGPVIAALEQIEEGAPA